MKKLLLIWIMGLLMVSLLVNYVSARPLCECIGGEPRYPSTCQLQVGGDHCSDTPPTCTATCTGSCGDGNISTSEECDFDLESGNPMFDGSTCEGEGFYSGTLGCVLPSTINECTFNTSLCTNCGNNQIDSGEDCDGLLMSNTQCAALPGGLYSSGTLSCKSDCTFNTANCVGQYTCGMYGCENGLGETNQTCLADCAIDGWNTDNTTWHLNNENRLVVDASPTESIIYSDFMNLRLGSTYQLSAEILNPVMCDISITLDNGFCLSGSDWTRKNCFTDTILLENSGTDTITLPSTDSDSSSGFFREVRLKITVASNCAAKFDNIEFKELPTIQSYNDLPQVIDSATACCPINTCWTGNECVQAYTDSQIAPIWNSLNIGLWPSSHVNITNYYMTIGYRCVLENNTASWQPAQLKYDWDFENSGYCNSDTDCFVNKEFATDPTTTGIIRTDCIRNGEFITDSPYVFDSGNHYCNNGVWTTKEYLIASTLQTIGSGKPYIIFCGESNEIFNSEIPGGVEGGCVLIVHDGNTDKIITGFYTDENLDNFPRDKMCGIMGAYRWLKDNDELYNCTSDSDFPNGYSQCTNFPSNDPIFERCLGSSFLGSDQPYLYIQTKEQYYLLSNEKISEIENTGFIYNIWNAISGFFQNLFGYEPTEPLALANQTTNYENLYLLNTDSLDVMALKEKKYDEQLATLMTYMYLNMTGTGIPEDNKFNTEFINETLQGIYYEQIKVGNSHSLLIKYNQPEELWPYLTAMLRDR